MIVVQMHGEPGSGKSTVARALAPLLDAVALDKDIVKSALLRSGIEERLAAPAAYEAYFELARDLVRQRRSLILDNPVYWQTVERRWLEITALAGSRPFLIECFCPERAEIARRLAMRDARESQPRDALDLGKHPGSTPTTYQPRLALDTRRPLDELVREAADFVLAGVVAS